ncbi:hypothetical protein ElyMa_006883300 [Elysia marginata]|uniref:Uncharacterized protein n=1 Tax=Elysia marginata TaxID=1093978 RepID=A0AAV4JEG6_9GAST|nr:hypothetical protein ElyMa_006883300 [Elysia marginata]
MRPISPGAWGRSLTESGQRLPCGFGLLPSWMAYLPESLAFRSRACCDRVFVDVSVADLFLHGGLLAQRITVLLPQGRRASDRYLAELILPPYLS